MGCDIHGMYERRQEGRWWMNAGNPDIGRNYRIFAVIGNVRNDDNIPFIGENRFVEEDVDNLNASDAFVALYKAWDSDVHSASYVTLKEMKEYDITRKYYDSSLVLSKDESGSITSTCRATPGKHLGEVGETTIFGVWGDAAWKSLIQYGENIRAQCNLTDEDVRLVFFFDN